ncbi:MAG TPA: hypothetical protein ENK82_01210 [Campylobacterales bacterium]|nr:hypothetical protein [Campylobacterales bacterium]HHS91944.1 hypothetical protein [Campylobacterales bacterium]
MKYYLIAMILLLLTGCGYKPSAHGVQKILGEQVFTQVDVSLSDPENAVLTKDALNIALQTRLKRMVSKKEDADSSILVRYKEIRFIPLQYDRNGYVVFYQAQIMLNFQFIKDTLKEEREIVGRFEFPIRPSAIISNDLRLKAIEQGSLKALDQFIAYLSVRGLLLDEK